jgi:glycosidase
MTRLFAVSALLISTFVTLAQSSIKRVDPPNWWVGMKNPKVQLLLYGPGAGNLTYTINYPGVTLAKTNKVENISYVFLDLIIAKTAKAGVVKIVGTGGGKTITQAFELKARKSERIAGSVTSADLIYLIMPDRFANGDPTNDKFNNMLDTEADPKIPYLRHGGDLKGIMDHLDYLQELGVTSLWMTPVIENDELQKKEGHGQMQAGYHGYHFTDHYAIDRRFGGNEAYIKLSKALHQRGMKLVQDAVYNHVSDDHWFYKDRPMKDWFNNWPSYTNSSHKEQPLFDPHSAAVDRDKMLDGWFTPFLPDLNQRNPYLANYLIQHAIWSTEMFNVDAWRIDTYKYNDQPFMNRCNEALLDEYPGMLLFGESVASNPLNMSYFVKSKVDFPFRSNLPSTNDFPLNYAFNDALRQNYGWDEGVNRIYNVLSQDAVFADPMRLVTQIDNHDMDRFLSTVGEDFDKFKMGITWLLTTRGIPSWYYGTEIMMKNYRNPSDAEVRKDFPGGWPGDTENKFTKEGRADKENEAFEYVKKLAQYRKNTPALHSGKLTQYLPQDGVYVYFRSDKTKTIMIATNSSDKEKSPDMSRFSEMIKGVGSGKNVMTGELYDLTRMTLAPKSVVVVELGK